MSAESDQRASFFDDDDLDICFEFIKPEKSHLKYLNSPPIMKGPLTRHPSNSDTVEKSFYALHTKLLAFYENPTAKLPQFVIDLSHSRLTVNMSRDSEHHSFIITKNATTLKFYSIDKKIIEGWAIALKGVCVLTNFHEEYKALKLIGKGSFAKVYLVEAKATKKQFAVKAFTKEGLIISNKGNAKPAMLNEIDIMRTVNHENIIKLHEVFETEKSIYLVVELIQGRSLQDMLKKGFFKEPQSENKIPGIIRSILSGLAYLATKGIMHRDLKPDNILFDKEEKIKIVDFGLATFIDVPEYIFKKCGTPGYIAPEVFKFDAKIAATAYDGHCDVFSIGGILYYMFFGTAFFEGSNASEILKCNRKFTPDHEPLFKIKKEIKDLMSKISKDGLNLLLQMLEFDHKRRPSAAQALTHPFFSPPSSSLQKIPSFRDYSEASSRGGSLSPTIMSPLKRISSSSSREKLTPLISDRNRFIKKDSLYLDIRRQEISGKAEAGESSNLQNSGLLRGSELGNSMSGSNSESLSPLRMTHYTDLKRPASRSFKGHIIIGNNQRFLKHSFSGMVAKNNDEDSKYAESPLLKLEQIKNEIRPQNSELMTASTAYPSSEKLRYGSHSPGYQRPNPISNDNSPFHLKLEQIIPTSAVPLNVTRMSQISGRKIQSFAYKH